MSITFSPDLSNLTPTGWVVACVRGHVHHRAESYAAAAALYVTAGFSPRTDECTVAGCDAPVFITADGLPEVPEVNLSNRNARVILRHLGLPDDDYGGCEAVDFLARCLLAANCAAFDGVPTVTCGGDGRVTLIDLGVDEDYVRRTAARLIDVADAARRLGAAVTWS